MINKVIKRNGKKEEFIASKLNYWGKWASENLNDRLDWSSVVLETVKSLPTEVTSKDLQNALIKVCIEKKDWPHSLMAGKLYSSMLQKDLYGYTMPTVREICKKLAKFGLMKSLDYSYAEYEEIEKLIDHNRDFNMAHFQIEYILNKYSIQNKKTKQFFETPQYTYMRMSLALAEDEPKSERLIHIKNWYNHFSLGRINAPTPNYNNLGTNHNGYSSCCLYTTKDTASSLAIGDHIAYTMTYMSAGIGGLINTRTLGDPIKNGLFLHQGKKPYLKAVAGAVNANKQGSRGGACTQYYSGFDPEANVIAQLQNPRSTEANRNRDIHFSVITNRLFAKKVATNQDIFTFTSFSAPDLFQKMFSGDQEGFEELYNQYEANPLFEKHYINARQFIISAIQQSYEVGTHYLTFIDEINRHTPFIESIYTSNLCQEITLPTHAYENIPDLYDTKDNGYIEYEEFNGDIIRKEYSELVTGANGDITFAGNLVEGIDIKRIIKKEQTSEVALCSLAAIVVPNIKSDEEYRSACYYALKMISKCIHMSEYALPHIGYTAKQRMSAGVGIVGLAYHLAKLGLKYNTKEGYEEIHKVAEKHSYFLIEQSLKIAKETQVAPWIHKTKWPKGWLPIDTYKRNVDNIINIPLQYDWEGLRKEIIANGGIAHSSLVAHMPTESSSKPVGVPNGLYPIRELSIKKSDQTNLIDWVAVDSDILKDKYQSAWDIPSKDLIKVYAIFQKFADQAISADLYKDRSKDINVSDSSMVSEYLDMIRYGMKTRYYQNSQVSNVEVDTNTRSCESGACDV